MGAWLAAAGVAAMMQPAASAPATPAPLSPRTPWQSFDEGYRCTAERAFGPGDGTVAVKFGITAFPVTPGANYLLLRGVGRIRTVRSLELVFDRPGPPVTLTPRVIELKARGTTLLVLGAPTGDLWDALRLARVMTVVADGKPLATVAIPGGASLVRTAFACARKQFLDFGGTAAAAEANLSGRSFGEGGGLAPLSLDWIASKDYPKSASTKNVSGASVIAFMVDPAGRPVKCAAVMSSGDLALDTAGCTALMARATFAPLADRSDPAARRVGALTMRWNLASPDHEVTDLLGRGFFGDSSRGDYVE